ncbi:MAG: MFS transporter [Hydrogenophaga sp.]|uniref:MFS transporter n=1 Tax=Hydrogenophaga sp. TaxID=1904254 RepID=UPI001690948F|nr:MFS transporter [Hydrogenophaga sp.]NIM41369.1 MFS transporter [Hydrogenophaga sp.]NIN26685.1 MFS transporter [Hydrogenophaga sp.]NIN30007.1 MFS transporter [Hydrogenophaga sp.]NIN55615.1 MFS transporter [Hydrogenophaga sp.]NIO52612.1 MFS transporter [Hydrogenophaga sp.]
MAGNTHLVLRLGTAQTLAWASSYYLPAILARPMAEGTGVPVGSVWMAFSMALLISAFIGPFAGRAIDRFGGRPVLAATSLVFASGLGMLSLAHGPVSLFAGWLLIGVAMGGGLYEAAFAALVRLQGNAARDAITGITLLAGLASTVGWPLSGWMEAHVGWRGACLGWAALHLLLGLPLNVGLPRAAALPPPQTHEGPATRNAPRAPRHVAWVLAYVFAATWFVSTALAAHLPSLLMASGLSLAGALAVGALVGPAQVAGRLLEFGGLRRFHPLVSARVAASMHPVGVLVWMAVGVAAAPVFAVLHGLGNGILTIAKGTLPLAYYGPVGYGRRQGWIVAPSRVAQAFAPLLFGALVERWGAQALWVSGALVASAWLGLLCLRPSPPDPTA